jgi:putative ABC transport system permease protein
MGWGLTKVFRLAIRDYFHEWQMSGCFVLALAAVLGPMLVLFGLKFGIVGAMVDQLIEDPRNREIHPLGSGHFDHAWLEGVRSQPQVAFLVPRTRSIAATIELSSRDSMRIVPVELIPPGSGDPLLAEPAIWWRASPVVLSRTRPRRALPGDTVNGSLARRFRGTQERVHLPLTVAAVAPAQAFPREGAFVSVRLLEALEDFRDGRAVPELGWAGEPADSDRSYPGFRLYARSIYDVAGLRDAFARLGVDVHTQAAQIELVQRMERNLTAIYWAIAVIGLGILPRCQPGPISTKRKSCRCCACGIHHPRYRLVPHMQALFTAIWLGWRWDS